MPGSKTKRKAQGAEKMPTNPVAPGPKPGDKTLPESQGQPDRILTLEEIEEVFRRFRQAEPEPQGELNWTNPYTLLVAVTLSAQATDREVNKATRRLFDMVQSPKDLLALGETDLKDHIKTIGLFNTKARNLIRQANQLEKAHAGVVPADRERLEALAGVGRKTANVVLNMAFGEGTLAVDTHVFRVANRTGLGPGKTVLSVEKALIERVPTTYLQHAHHWLILHGRYVCKARVPDCGACAISDLCRYPAKA